MTAIELMPDDPFIACLYDAPNVAVWRHDDAPVGLTPEGLPAHHVVTITAGVEVLNESLSAAMQAIPDGEPFLIGLETPQGIDFGPHAVLPVD